MSGLYFCNVHSYGGNLPCTGCRITELEGECIRLLNRAIAAEERADALQRCLQSQPAH